MPERWLDRIATRARRLSWLPSRSAAVLVYHRVATPTTDPYGLAVSPTKFERQLREARRRGQLVPARELVARLASGQSVKGLIVITFDDGYVDNLVAAGIAAEVDVPLTVFITVEPVLEGAQFWWDQLALAILGTEPSPVDQPTVVGGVTLRLASRRERLDSLERLHVVMRGATASCRAALLHELIDRLRPPSATGVGRPMTEHELRELVGVPGVSIGAHTMTHPSLASLDAGEQLQELRSSREALERRLGAPIRLVAYPFGKTDNVSLETRTAARAAGFDAAFTTIPQPVGRGTDLMAIPRMTVHDWSDDEFRAKLGAMMR